MPTSQFTYYSSGDASAPVLSGTAGTLLNVLNACLVTGYGAKAPAGWTKPLADSGNVGCFRNGTGSSQMTLHVDDSATVLDGRAALAAGWVSLSTVASPVGTGSGQFPLASQFNTSGYCAWNKSTTASGTVREWQIFADAYTMYLWMDTGSSGYHDAVGFGDVYSLKPTTDDYRCLIYGTTNNYSQGVTSNHTDTISICISSAYPPNRDTTWDGVYMARTSGGGGGSIVCIKGGDNSASALVQNGYPYGSQYGYIPYSTDNALYLSPIKIYEQASGAYRGRMRGLYYPLHVWNQFSNGQVFNGSGDYAGKTFQVVCWGRQSGVWLVETSNTVETN